jgi:hypothetical protein
MRSFPHLLFLILCACGGPFSPPQSTIPVDLYLANCTTAPTRVAIHVAVGDDPQGPGTIWAAEVPPSSEWQVLTAVAHGFWWEAVRVEVGEPGQESAVSIAIEKPRAFCAVEVLPPATVTGCGPVSPDWLPCRGAAH